MRIVDRGVVYAGQKGTDTQSCAFPGICVLPEGRWLCSFRAAPAKGSSIGQHVRLTWSDDEGRSWTAARAPFAPKTLDGRPGLFRGVYVTALGERRVLAALCWVDHSDPALPFFNEETEGLLDTNILLAESGDSGETWSRPELMDTCPFQCPTPLTGPVLRLQSGKLACQFELNKTYYDPGPWRHSSVMMFSGDAGKTWPEHVITSNDPENRIFWWDQRPGVLADGTILDVFWTYDNQQAVYLNIHACQSRDNGRTWSEMWDTGIPGQPAQPVSLPDSRIGMVYVDRTGSPTIKLRVSSDGGRTWPDETEVVLHAPDLEAQTRKKGSMQDAWSEMSAFSMGLPATARLGGGDVLAVYYAGPETDITDIHWVRVAHK